MKVLIAPDSFKDALRADAAALHIANGLKAALPDVVTELVPIADGGEGFADAIARGSIDSASTRINATTDPLGRPIDTRWVRLDRRQGGCTAVIELAAASGLERLALQERDPIRTTTFGTGQLIREALTHRPGEVLLGIGGSATNDGGCGIAQALGVCFRDERGETIALPITGGDLLRISAIEIEQIESALNACTLRIACDVDNPLTGPSGAAHIYAPQKGATPQQVDRLDRGLRHLAGLWREQLGVEVEQLAGAGAAGGVGGGLVAMLGATLVPGAELVLEAVGLSARLADADWVITGEGRLDGQSLQGKAAMAVARRAKAAGVPCVALVGSVGDGAERALNEGLASYRVIGEGLAVDESIRRTGELLERAAAQLAREELN